jgi:serine protease
MGAGSIYGVVHLKARLFAAVTVSALLAACSGGGQTTLVPSNTSPIQPDSNELTVLSTFSARNTQTGELVRIFPTTDALSAARLAAGNQRGTLAVSNLQYYGGPVQTAPKLYVVFWGSAWNGSGDPNGEKNLLTNFYGVIGGSKWLNSVTQYTQSGGAHVGNPAGMYAGSYVDTSSSPPSRPTQAQMAAEAAKAAAHFGNYSSSASYVVAMPHGIKPSGFGTQYCAYHSSTSANGSTISWTNLPYITDAGASCGSGSVNSPGTSDGVTIVSGHEQGETMTDPQPNSGWLDSSGAENGDKCAWTGLENNPNAGGYPTQPLWSNANNGCVQSY